VYRGAYFSFSVLPVLLVRLNTLSAEYNVRARPPIMSNVPINGHSAKVRRPPSTIPKAHIEENKPIINCPPALNVGMPPHALRELKVSEFLGCVLTRRRSLLSFAVVWLFPSEFSTRLGFFVVTPTRFDVAGK